MIKCNLIIDNEVTLANYSWYDMLEAGPGFNIAGYPHQFHVGMVNEHTNQLGSTRVVTPDDTDLNHYFRRIAAYRLTNGNSWA